MLEDLDRLIEVEQNVWIFRTKTTNFRKN
jgi:hypothetical protein